MSDGNGYSNIQILERLEKKVDKVLEDHEARLRFLESGHNRLRGAVALLSFLLVVAGALISALNI